ncbi:MAG: alpha/beta hydrolase [Candidatus Saccharimonas sp.]
MARRITRYKYAPQITETDAGVGVSRWFDAAQNDQPELLLIGGLRSTPQSLHGLQAELYSRGINSTMIDATRAHSLRHQLTVTAERYAQLVQTTLRDVSPDIAQGAPYDCMGHSQGGVVAQQVAYHDGNLEKLILNASVPGAALRPMDAATAIIMGSPYRSEADAGAIYGGVIRQDPALAKIFGLLQESPTAQDHETYRQQVSVFLQAPELIERFVQLRNDTLLISDRDDPIVPPENSEIMEKLLLIRNGVLHLRNIGAAACNLTTVLANIPIPQQPIDRVPSVKMVYTEGLGHMGPIVSPTQTADILEPFLRRS